MRPRHIAILCLSAVCIVAGAGTALGQSATIDWRESFDSRAPANNPTIYKGESVTWNVTSGGHNVDVTGPENWKSTSGSDPKGAQITHTFNTPGKYTYLCDYHSSMHGTITVTDAPPPQPAPQPSPSPSPSNPQPSNTPQPVTGDAPSTTAPAAVDAAAPQLARVSLRRATLRVRLSEPAKLTIRLSRWLRHGRYHVSVVATDAAGNVSRPVRLALTR